MTKVVVVDDNEEIVAVVKRAAEALSIACVTTTKASEFVRLVDSETSLVIIDLDLPGTDGLQLMRRLREAGYSRNFVVMSGADQRVLESTEALAREHGFSVIGRLAKAFTPADLQAVLRAHATPSRSALPKKVATELSVDELNAYLSRESVELHFQPQIELATATIVGVEALVRIRSESGELIYPDRFISVAERSGGIVDLDRLVARKSIQVARTLMQSVRNVPVMSINLSVHSLRSLGLPDWLERLSRESGVLPKDVLFEVTESGEPTSLAELLEVLGRLRIKGFQLSIDDFGAGYAMLEQLRNVPATELKIDRQFVQQMLTADSARAAVLSAIRLAHELKLRVVAEGVENKAQLAFLRENDCDVVQGYLICKPIELDSLVDRILQGGEWIR